MWSTEGHGTGGMLSMSGQYFLGVGIISDVTSCNPTQDFLHKLSYMLQHHGQSRAFEGLNFAFINHKIKMPIIRFI
jgi:hypothetical protein